MKDKLLRIFWILSIILLNVGCDQVSKNIVRKNISENDFIPLIKGFLTLTKIENTGAFLSLGDSLPDSFRFILLSLIPVLIVTGGTLFLLLKKTLSRNLTLGFSFVAGGGMGNLYDRMKFGSVTDFLHMDFYVFQTGIFNLADVSIMAGMGIVLFETFFENKMGSVKKERLR